MTAYQPTWMETRRKTLKACFTMTILAVVFGQASASDSSRTIAFENVRVISMDSERVLADQTVVIRGQRIAAIGPADSTAVPGGAVRIDATGKFLMPGLADMHAHPGSTEELTLFVANGVTTIRNMWGFPDEHLVWRKQVQKGDLLGPRIFTTGPILDGDPPSFPGSEVVTTPEQARKAVAAHKEAGYDHIKVLYGITPVVYDAIMQAAKENDIDVVGHVPLAVDLDHVLTSGQTSIEHLEGYAYALQADGPPADRTKMASARSWLSLELSKLDEVVEATKKAGVWNCPTLGVFRRLLPEDLEKAERAGELKYVGPGTRRFWDSILNRPSWPERVKMYRASMPSRRQVVKALSDGGSRLLLGTDTPNLGIVPGFSIHWELANFVEAGLTPFQAIQAGTSAAAEFLEASDQFGTIAPGKAADLILLDANPLEDIGNTTKQAGVMVRGRWIPRSEILSILKTVAAKYESEKDSAQAASSP